MEKKKLLFVAISVGIFLVLTIGAAIIVFAPKYSSGAVIAPPVGAGVTMAPPLPYTQVGTGAEATGRGSPPATLDTPVPAGTARPVDALDLVRNNVDVPGLRPLPEGAGQQGGFHVQGQPPTSTETRINVPRPSTTAVPDTPPAGRAAPVPTQRVQPQPPVHVAPATRPAPAARPAPTTPTPTPATLTTPAASPQRPVTPTRAHHDYWVQTGAFSTVTNAEGVKDALASKGIASIIDNRIIDGRPLFRVRVGPYTSINEANYWLALIKSIDGFEESQIRQTETLR
jgi:DedD protein